MKINNQWYASVILGLVTAAVGNGTATAQVQNTAYGAYALISNTTGNFDSAFGYYALKANTTGNSNTAIGQAALQSNTTGNSNTAIGEGALAFNTTGNNNVANGWEALVANRTGRGNTASGYFALHANSSGGYNAASGINALYSNTTGRNNTADGSSALYGNTTGIRNVAFGSNTLYKNTTGDYNHATGYQSLYSNTTGSNNSASGYAALYSNTTGSNNIAVGQFAGYFPTTGSNNIEIGNRGVAADNAVIRIGTQETQRTTYLAGVVGVNVIGGVPVMVTATGQLGVVSSSRRYKEDIRSMGDTSDRLLKLRPVTFRYKQPNESGQKPEQYGLIAEEVAKVMPELVIYNEKGRPETVAYQTLTPLLLNELQREHGQLSTQGAELKALRAEVAELRRAVGKR